MGVVRFGPFSFDSNAGALNRDEQPVALGGRAAALLGALVKAEGAVVGKAELMDAGWPGVIVEDGNLTVQVTALRKALGAREDGTEWITTVPRVGYRLVRTEPAAPGAADGRQREPSIAVLPFQNLSSDPEQDYFADGVVEDIITALSRFRTLRVAARNSSFVHKGKAVDLRQAGLELGVGYLVEGSVRKSGPRLRITAQLVDATTGAHIWAENYDGAVEDVFAVQDSITETVASIIEPAIVQAEIERRQTPPANPDAYDLYLQALPKVFQERPNGPIEALALIDRSLALDPHFGRALALANRASMPLLDNPAPGIGPEIRERAVGYARRSLRLAGADSQMRAFAGLVLIMAGPDYDTGLAATRRAAGDNPNDVSVLISAAVAELWAGDLSEAASFFRRALRLNPHDYNNTHWAYNGLAHIAILEGRLEEALDLATQADSIDPHNEIVYWSLVAANVLLGRIDEAKRWRERLQGFSPSATISRMRTGQLLREQHRIDVLIDGLRAAGLPE